jgi:hypothetical protein
VNRAGVPKQFLEGSGVSTMHIHARFSAGLLLLAALAGLLPGCNKESEGDRCDPLSGNAGDNDCEPPLVCTPFSVTPSQSVYRCCPPAGTAVTQAVCIVPTDSRDTSPAVPPDGSAVADVDLQGGGDGSPDETVDASSSDDSTSTEGQEASTDDGGGGEAMDDAADVGTDE